MPLAMREKKGGLVQSQEDFEIQIKREWLLTNGRGGYVSNTVLGIPSRRYHGLLIAAARPPLERWLLLSAILERIRIDGTNYELASFQFANLIHPQGYVYLKEYAAKNDSHLPWARFLYENEKFRFSKEIIMPKGADEVVVQYRFEGPTDAALSLELAPMTAMRDFHALTHAYEGGFAVHEMEGNIAVDSGLGWPRLWMQAERSDIHTPVKFDYQPDWWHSFVYSMETARGLDDREDLFIPGWFCTSGAGSIELIFRATADFSQGKLSLPDRIEPSMVQVPRAEPASTEEMLREAADAFVVVRQAANDTELTTLLAGYHWFGDWGRDTFIALPGLLLETQRYDQARQVLKVFASAQQDGLIPNRFSDYGDGRDYNSIDASLWFIHAAGAYCDQTGDEAAWQEFLGPACEKTVNAFVAGTKFNIYLDNDGLVNCGDENTQLTWMDAKCGNVVFTPRHGKPVEINALWYHGLCVMAGKVEAYSPQKAAQYRELAGRAKEAFVKTFWNEAYQCLYDVVRDNWHDLAIRPNQIFAVSLPHSMLDKPQQESVLWCVHRELLTPYGLRSLAASHPSYRGCYEGNPFERDSRYHQGTVWGWLMGPYVEAYLRVHDFSSEAKARMRKHLQPLIEHFNEAGLGSVSEIFDGDAPHTPRGCIAQAWSVSELLRAWRMTEL